MEQYYPVLLKSSSLSCIIFGGGQVAFRKAEGLLRSGVSSITVVAPKLGEQLELLMNSQQHHQLLWKQDVYKEQYMIGHQLVFAATDDKPLNAMISSAAVKHGAYVCDVSNGERGNFINPAVITEGNLMITISTQGTSPAWSKEIKQRLQKEFAQPYSAALRLMGRLRDDLEKDKVTLEQRKVITEKAMLDVLDVSEANYEQWYDALRNQQTVMKVKAMNNDGSKSD